MTLSRHDRFWHRMLQKSMLRGFTWAFRYMRSYIQHYILIYLSFEKQINWNIDTLTCGKNNPSVMDIILNCIPCTQRYLSNLFSSKRLHTMWFHVFYCLSKIINWSVSHGKDSGPGGSIVGLTEKSHTVPPQWQLTQLASVYFKWENNIESGHSPSHKENPWLFFQPIKANQ